MRTCPSCDLDFNARPRLVLYAWAWLWMSMSWHAVPLSHLLCCQPAQRIHSPTVCVSRFDALPAYDSDVGSTHAEMVTRAVKVRCNPCRHLLKDLLGVK